ncbi:MAG: chromate transporter [Lachnospiraceae bacterium]|jgi:chromate transporter
MGKLKEYLILYWTMFVIGLTTFGGGYAMVGIIDRELGQKKKWIERNELLDYIAISQITPGVIAVNVSTFVGRKLKGAGGAVMATLGVISPSIIIIMIIAAVLTNFADNEYVRHAFAGIRICVCALILHAVIGFLRETIVDWLTLVTYICVFAVAAFTRISTVYIVLGVIVISVVVTIIHSKHPLKGVKIEGFTGAESPAEGASADKESCK